MTGTRQDSSYLYKLTESLNDGEFIKIPSKFKQTIPNECLLSKLGIELVEVGRGRARAKMTAGKHHLNQRGVVQAGGIIALADATAGWASYSALEHGRFTTLNLGASLIRAANVGDGLIATASPIHLGNTTQVFEVTVTNSSSLKTISQFNCTQLVLGSTH